MHQRDSSPQKRPNPRRAEPTPGNQAAFDWAPLAIAGGSLLYLVLFYFGNASSLLAIRWLLIPDIVLSNWLAGDSSRFGISDRIPILMAAGLLLLLATATGRLLLDASGVTARLTRLETVIFSAGVGLSLWSLFTLAVGLAGQLQNRWILFAPAPVVIILTVTQALRRRRSAAPDDDSSQDAASQKAPANEAKQEAERSSPTPAPLTNRGWSNALWVLNGIFAVFIVLGSLLPPWHFDVREYHSQVPKEWFREGAIGFMPHNVYGNMPLGAELHSILGMALMPGEDAWWWGALVGKALIGAFAILTALAVYAMGKRFLTPLAGAIAAVAFLSTPWIAHVSTAGLIESAVALYFILTLQATLMWWKPGSSTGAAKQRHRDADQAASGPEGQTGLILLAGFLAGSAVACKYPSLLFLVIPVLMFVLFASSRRPDWRMAVLFLLSVGSASGLWFGKNLVLTGNPTYPLLYEVFDGETRTPEKHAQWAQAHRTPTDGEGRRFTASQLVDTVKNLAFRSQFTSPLLLPLVFAAWMSRRDRSLVFWCTMFLLFGVSGWWVLTHRIDRFLLPMLPVACLLVGVGATWTENRFWRVWVICFVSWCGLTNLLLITSPDVGDVRYLTSLASLRTVVHPGHAYLNDHVQSGNRVLLVGDAQPFDLAVDVLYNTCFDDCQFEQRFRDKTLEQRLEILRKERISHILVDWLELRRYRSPGNYGYSDYITPARLQADFVARGLLRPAPVDLDPQNAQVFEVVGWRDWPP